MKTLNSNNLDQFALIDEIHNGYTELSNSNKLKEKLNRLGGEVQLQPIQNMNFRPKEKLIVKCQQSGTFFQVIH